MAELLVEGDDLVLHLTGVEKAESLHADLRVPRSSVRGIEVLADAYEPVGVREGFKVGMRVPGRAMVGSVRRPGRKIFGAVHHDTPRGVRVLLEGASYDEWIVGCADPEALRAALLPGD